MTKTIRYTIFFIWLICSNKVIAQQPAYTYYSIRDGLPSNDIYNCIEDKKGFLWIATENGLAKFDGKNFKIYTTTQGLPDNEILGVDVDSAGVIWVLPFQKSPAYYDEKSDRFINNTTDPELEKISSVSLNKATVLSGGGMGFCNSRGGVFIYQQKRCIKLKFPGQGNVYSPSHQIIQLDKNSFLVVSADSIRLWRNEKFIGSKYLGRQTYRTVYVNNNVYLADSMRLIKMKIFPDGTIGETIENALPFEISNLNFTGNQIAISSPNGNIYLADTATLAFSQQAFSFNALVRFLYEDKAGNTWICTKENGLIRYQKKGILTISEPAFQRNFNTLAFFKNTLIAGTNNGRIFFYKGPYDFEEKILSTQKSYENWIRKIVAIKDRLYVASEGPLYLLEGDSKKVVEMENQFVANKGMYPMNDSVLIIGNTGYIKKVNLNTNKLISQQSIRITALNADADRVYLGSNSGLYRWESNNNLKYFGTNYKLLSTRVSALMQNKYDRVLWVGLAKDTLVAMIDDVPVAMIPMDVHLPGNICRTLFCSKKGIVWVGTNKALARINYDVKNNKIIYSTTVFTTADGIAGKQINDIIERNDTMYVATTAGISIVPAGLNYNAPDIPVFISGIKINNKDVGLEPEYDLPWNNNNISIIYTATDLAATTERIYQYRINKGAWVTTQNENIELQQLGSGKYILQVRALKRDGVPSGIFAEMIFNISTPFWKSIIFYLIVFTGTLLLLFYFFQKQSRKKREQDIQKLLTEKRLQELELKALKAQINPHFVFNCLNSIKFLNHRKRFTETEKYLDKFSYLLRKTLDFSGLQQITLEDELEYSRNYLELEKLRIGEKMHFEIYIEADMDAKEIMVPPMLFQPYLENAVKHGIRYLHKDVGTIHIDINKQGQHIICKITDNGIGIENAMVLNKKINPKHVSHGNTLQERRASLYGIGVGIKQKENNSGTEVTLTINNTSPL